MGRISIKLTPPTNAFHFRSRNSKLIVQNIAPYHIFRTLGKYTVVSYYTTSFKFRLYCCCYGGGGGHSRHSRTILYYVIDFPHMRIYTYIHLSLLQILFLETQHHHRYIVLVINTHKVLTKPHSLMIYQYNRFYYVVLLAA